ncbi:Lrp/AsnC ligand binding domain-containing protein [Tomitella biformata]|uniref:Lrp/AsnC ligand binding domain-containing protein n=1 Tax=Tomitella biformata TaxID=630403 RepID=UPI0004B0249F
MAYPRVQGLHGNQLAIAEISCVSGHASGLARELATWPTVVTVEESAREYSLVVTIVGLSLQDLAGLILDDLPGLPGVLGVRTHLVAKAHIDASSWRIGGLDHQRAQAVSRLPLTGGAEDRPVTLNPWADPHVDLARALAEDGRRTAADLARLTDRPLSTVRRQLGHLLSSDALTFRCEVAQGLTAAPIVVQWWCHVPITDVPACVSHLRTVPSVRQVVSIPGRANLLVSTWSRSASDAMGMQQRLEHDLAPLQVVDSAVILRQVKRLGWMLDHLGRNTGVFVPYTAGGRVSDGS